MTKSRTNADNVSGDIAGITAGTGLTGGGTGGTVTLDLTTPVASTNGGTGLSSFTTGDIIYSSSGNTLAKLGIGTTSQVLTVAGGVPSWAAASSGFTFTTWTPTWTRLTVGNGTVVARYGTSGKFTFFDLSIIFGSTTSITGNNPEFTLPVAPLLTNRPAGQAYVMVTFLDEGNQVYFGTAGDKTSTAMSLFGALGSSRANLSATAPFTFGTNDAISVAGVYEAA